MGWGFKSLPASMKHKFLSILEIEKLLEPKYEYKNVTQQEIENAMEELYVKQSHQERKIKIWTWRGGYKLFCKAMEEAGAKMLNQNQYND